MSVEKVIRETDDLEKLERILERAILLDNQEIVAQIKDRQFELQAGSIDAAARRCIKAKEKANGGRYAGRTWPMIDKHGAQETVRRMVCKKDPSDGFHELVAAGDYRNTFEYVASVEFPELFDDVTIARAQERLAPYLPADDA